VSITDSYLYTAFGILLSSSGITANTFKFIGRRGYFSDADLADYYIRARHYISVVARFLSRDPLLDEGSFLRADYAYGRNNPANRIDPSGTITVEITDDPSNTGHACGTKPTAKFKFTAETVADCDQKEGYIIQRVSVSCVHRTCPKNCKDCVYTVKLIDSYFEAWKVTTKSPSVLDTAFFTCVANTCGRYLQETTIKFFCATNELKKTIGSWKPRGPHGIGLCKTGAGSLPSIDANPEPKFWKSDSPEDPGERTYDLTWCCCTGKNCTNKCEAAVAGSPAPPPPEKK
jgi:RHS repeat-associated protein